VKKFHRLQEFILVWPGDEAKPVMYDGELFVMPPHDQVAEVGPGMPYRYESVHDPATGRKIPGTMVVKDRIQDTPTGGRVKLFDVVEFCDWLESNREDLINQGLGIVDSTDEVAQAMAVGRPKYERSQDDYARTILQQELERRKKWDQKGIPAPQSSSEHKVLWAAQHLENRAKQAPAMSDDAIRRVLGGGTVVERPKVGAQIAADAAPGVNDAERAPGELFDLAESAGITLTKAEMGKLLRNDLEYRDHLLKQIAAKQEGVPTPA
jgi:hypothetical protein